MYEMNLRSHLKEKLSKSSSWLYITIKDLKVLYEGVCMKDLISTALLLSILPAASCGDKEHTG